MSIEEEAAFYAKWARERIEALGVDFPAISRTAYTHRRTVHIAFGSFTPEAANYGDRVNIGFRTSIGDLAEDLVAAVRIYAASVEQPRIVVWRSEPEFTRQNGRWGAYCRLCFEPHPCPEMLS